MKIEDRLKMYQTFTDLGRKWSAIMDAKAGFISTINLALIGFIWTGAKLGDISGWSCRVGLLATAIAASSLYFAIRVVLPRTTLAHAFGAPLEYTKNYKAVSFFSYIAANYPHEKHAEFIAEIGAMSEEDFAQEALEQHFTISHIVQKKSDGVARAGLLWFVATSFTVIALVIRG